MKKVESFRRCHVCGLVTHKEQSLLQRCGHCKKAFAPFFYYDDFTKPVLSEDLERPPLLKGEWPPIQGLTAYW